MNNKYLIIIVGLIITVFSNTVYSSTGIIIDPIPNQSIKELKNGIIELNKDKNELNIEFFVLNQDQKLKEYIKDSLNNIEINKIKKIISLYLENKSIIDTKIKIKSSEFLNTENERNQLLVEKKNFYKNLTPFIKKYELQEYLKYIVQDVKLLKEKGEVSEQLILQNEIIENKVEIIEGKIKEHREYLNQKFDLLINQIIDEKTNQLINNKKFLLLEKKSRELVISKILIRIQITISNIEKKLDKTDALNKKLEIYKRVYLKLTNIKDNL